MPGREKTPAFRNGAAERGRAIRMMNPAAAVPGTEGPPLCPPCITISTPVRAAESRASPGTRVRGVRRAHGGRPAAFGEVRSRGPPARRRSTPAGRSCQPPSGGTGLRVCRSDRMATSSSLWATRGVTSSAAKLPHRCEMQRARGRAARGGSRLPRQRDASEQPAANRLEIC